MGGARIELLLADSETKPDVVRSEADRLIISPGSATFLANSEVSPRLCRGLTEV
jgi:hypothetical protein